MFRVQGFLSLAMAVAMASPALAQYAVFDQTTDTISVSGDTTVGTAVTYEAVIRPSDLAGGLVWNEWQAGAEDKQFGLRANNGVYGYADLGDSNPLDGGFSAAGGWHHYAYVYDGSQERVYIDGNLEASRSANGDVPDGASSVMVVGAIIRNNNQQLYPSFIGDIDSLRISNTARYSGTSFVPTLGDMTSDASTLLLYNFDNAPGATVISDESGNGHTGTLGTGFDGATSPTFVPEPSALTLLGISGVAVLRRRARARRLRAK